MPTKPKKPCRYPGCADLTNEYYCQEHQSTRNAEYNKFRRDPALQRIYNGKQWRALSKRQLERQPLCESCLKANRYEKAEIADHIQPIKHGGPIYDLNNLQSLCIACHNKKTADE